MLTHQEYEISHCFMNRTAIYPRVKIFVTAINLQREESNNVLADGIRGGRTDGET